MAILHLIYLGIIHMSIQFKSTDQVTKKNAKDN